MKKLLTALALVAFCAPAHAETPVEICTGWGQVAENVMWGRQLGAAMSDYMAVAEGNAMLQAIVTDAYAQPRYQTDAAQIRAVEDFRSAIELVCFRSFSEGV